MNENLISIIIPTFNCGNTLSKTINTLLSQSIKSIEIVIIDNNSTDNTENLIYNFQKEYNNIKYIKNNNNYGPGIARNTGILNSKGNYICFLDSDDWIDLYAFEIALDTFNKNPNCDLVIWGIKNEFNNLYSTNVRLSYNNLNKITKDIAMGLLCNSWSLDIKLSSYLGNKMFKRELIEKTGFFDKYVFEDAEFSFKAISQSNEIILLPNLYTHYFQREQSIIHSFSQKYIDDAFDLFKNLEKYVSNFPQYYKDFCSLIEKVTKTLFNIMFERIINVEEQKKYTTYYFEKLLQFTTLKEIINYLDIDRIKKIIINN